jgi:hypothetical protein
VKKIYALDGELAKFKFDLKFVEKCMNDNQEIFRMIGTLEDKLEA